MTEPILPPKPPSRPREVSFLQYIKLFRQDILSAQPARLYRAWMAEFRTPFFRSYMINQPELLDLVLKERPDDFPKSGRVSEGLRPLLGHSVFLTNGDVWKKQRRIIDPAFEGGRLKEAFPAMWDAAGAAVKRLAPHVGAVIDIESQTSHAAADVITRTLFSVPIEDEVASRVFHEFRTYQRSSPILNIAAVIPLPKWMPRFFSRETRASAREIRKLITQMTKTRAAQIKTGTAPEDLATKIMTTKDPLTGDMFSSEEMVDQVAIFFLAGHETSASALAWALYLMALYPDWQDKVAEEVSGLECEFSQMSKLRITRDVFRETLRLYPPVPMMVRQATKTERFRDREVTIGSQIVVSPWHIHRNERLWDNPDGFDPTRWQTHAGKESARGAFIPFSSGARVCTGAGFAMLEGVLLLAMILKAYRVKLVPGAPPPVPEAHLTVRARDGIKLILNRR